MKKQCMFVLTTVVCAVLLVACDSTKATISIPEDDVEYVAHVFGSDDFLEPVAGMYAVTEQKGSLTTSIPLKIVKGERNPNFILESFVLYVRDSKEQTISAGSKLVEFQAVDPKAAYKSICDASLGDVVKVTFQYTPTNSKEMDEIAKAIVSCVIELNVDEPDEDDEEEKSTSSSQVVKTASSAKSSVNWDKVLDSYEQYADKYIAVMKKVNAGDASAYSEMAELMQQCNDLGEKLENANDDMSAAQIARFQKIMNKFASAAAF